MVRLSRYGLCFEPYKCAIYSNGLCSLLLFEQIVPERGGGGKEKQRFGGREGGVRDRWTDRQRGETQRVSERERKRQTDRWGQRQTESE